MASAESYAEEGWLVKEGGSWKSWKRRFFRIDGVRLLYYRDETKKQLHGSIDLSLATSIRAIDDYHKKFAYTIRICTPSRTFHIAASSPEDRLLWLHTIIRYSEEHNIAKPRVSKIPVTDADFEIRAMLGKGAFGKVFLVRFKATGEYFAMKSIEKRFVIENTEVDHTMAERKILSKLHHPFLVNLHYSFQTASHLFYIIDYCPGGEMFNLLQKKGRIPEQDTKFYVAQILLALEHLHASNIIYRDLKPENILVGRDGFLRLTDFGLSKMCGAKGEATATLCGTSEYLAPEMIAGQPYTESVDWWEFGVLIYEMIVGHAPFRAQKLPDLFAKIVDDPVVFPQASYPSAECKELVALLLDKDPATRLGEPNAIKKQPWFNGFDWDALYAKKLPPPFVPLLRFPEDLAYFNLDWVDPDEKLGDAPAVPNEQNPFADFTYVK